MELEIIRAAVDGSKTLTNLSLTIIGGSIAMLIGTSYRRPRQRILRLPYLLFGVGWIFLLISILAGKDIVGLGIVAELSTQVQSDIILSLNKLYATQVRLIEYSVYCFGAWLIFYLIWFIVHNEEDKKY